MSILIRDAGGPVNRSEASERFSHSSSSNQLSQCCTTPVAHDVDSTEEDVVNAYSSAADPLRYRQLDKILSSCNAHKRAAVLCYTAGKTGRVGRTATIGATPFWLTCSHINNLVARLEQQGALAAVARLMRGNTKFSQAHAYSHVVYAQRVKQLLSHDQWIFFHAHFVAPADLSHRKFGNAAVSHVHDLKCLHALVAQSLCGASNPIGDIILNFIVFMHTLLPPDAVDDKRVRALSRGSCSGCDDTVARTLTRDPIDSVEVFENFIHAAADAMLCGDARGSFCGVCGADSGQNACCSMSERARHHSSREDASASVSFSIDVPSPSTSSAALLSVNTSLLSSSPPCVQRTHVWQAADTFEGCKPDLCQQAYDILLYLLGKPPRSHRKRRIN